MKPLQSDALQTTMPSRAEKVLWWVPLVGWPVAHALQGMRFRPIIEEIHSQLSARPDTSECWGAVPRHLSGRLRSVIARELAWPNDHFLPDDPFRIVFWAHRDGEDDVWTIKCIEEEYGIEIGADDLTHLWQGGTLGRFVTLVVSRITEKS